MKKLEKANEYVQLNRLSEEVRPTFHVTPPVGWMNDPNGLSFYNGKIHLFYQFHPYSTVWGPMHWGHVVTEDFINWTELPVALAPDSNADFTGCFSGTAIEVNGNHVIAYTGVVAEPDGAGGERWLQSQCVAIGDGESYIKEETNPVIPGTLLPEGFSHTEFRDPKIWQDESGVFKLIAVNKNGDDIPQIVLFESENLKKWRFVSVLSDANDINLGSMWECPDYFRMDEKDVLIFAPQNMTATEEFHDGNNSACCIGEIRDNRFEAEKIYSLDYGFDFYAPQTMELPDGRRILIGWMQAWETSDSIPKELGFAGMMTFPRELEIINGNIWQRPVREIEKYFDETVIIEKKISSKGMTLEKNKAGAITIPEVSGRIMDLMFSFTDCDFTSININLAENEKYKTVFTINNETNEFICDRSDAGWLSDTASVRSMKIRNKDGIRNIRFIMDKYSIEAFINDGEQVFSTTAYTPLDADGVSVEVNGDVKISVRRSRRSHDHELRHSYTHDQ